jgi:hypothetical protein
MAASTALNPDAVLIGTSNGPGIYIAPVGTAAPTDASTAPAAAWTTLGYLSEDGVTFGTSTNSENITPWQSRSPVRTIITSRELTVDFTMLEFSAQNVALYFGGETPTETAGAFSMTVRSDSDVVNHAILVDVKDGDNVVRYHFPRATLSEAGDIEITQSGAVGLPVTLMAMDDAGVLCNIIKGSATAAPAAAKATTA